MDTLVRLVWCMSIHLSWLPRDLFVVLFSKKLQKKGHFLHLKLDVILPKLCGAVLIRQRVWMPWRLNRRPPGKDATKS